MREINRYLGAIAIFVLLLATSVNSSAGKFKVTHVTDGDTVHVAANGGKIKIRLVGIDAPETSKKKNQTDQPFSRKSTKYLTSLVFNKHVDLKSCGTDRYGRILGVIFVGEKNVNLEMVKAGLSEVYRGRPAKGFDVKPYWNAENEANKAGIGIWSLGDKYISPKEWRKMHRK
jgi:micrococcal nuclease